MTQTTRAGTAVICDDDPMVRRIVTAVLHHCGFADVVATPKAARAAELVADLHPEVVVLDLCLEHESGLDVIPLMRVSSPATPIIVYSSARKGKQAARDAGAYRVIDKVSMTNANALATALRSLRPSTVP